MIIGTLECLKKKDKLRETMEYLIPSLEINLQLYNHSMIFAFYFQETICHHHQYDIQV